MPINSGPFGGNSGFNKFPTPKGPNVPSTNVHVQNETVKGGYGGVKQTPDYGGKGNFDKGSDPGGKMSFPGAKGGQTPAGQGKGPGGQGGEQGKSPGQHLSGMAQAHLQSLGMSPQGVRQLASGQMPTSPGDQQVVFQVIGQALG